MWLIHLHRAARIANLFRSDEGGDPVDALGNLPAGLGCEVPPSGRVCVGVSVRRYVSLREPHLRLCTFASPRRVPSGHGEHVNLKSASLLAGRCALRARGAWRPPGTNPDREKSRGMGWAWRQMGTEPLLTDATPAGSWKNVGGTYTRGLRPRAIGWVCSASLNNAHPDGCERVRFTSTGI